MRDLIDNPIVVWKRRVAKFLSWEERGFSLMNFLYRTVMMGGMIALTVKGLNVRLPSWIYYLMGFGIIILAALLGRWDSIHGFRQFQSEYDGEDIHPPHQKMLKDLGLIKQKLSIKDEEKTEDTKTNTETTIETTTIPRN